MRCGKFNMFNLFSYFEIPAKGLMRGDELGTIFVFGIILCSLIPYLLGSLNFAVLISRRKFKDDVRKYGSGNAGMTNMLRTYGKSIALFTFLGDALKAALSIVIGSLLLGEMGAYLGGLFCIVGHVYPLYFNFKGGKGVVTSSITVLFIDPQIFLILLVIFILLVAFTRFISLGSIVCISLYPILLFLFGQELNLHVLFALIIAGFVVFLHRENIKRLLNKSENKISFRTK